MTHNININTVSIVAKEGKKGRKLIGSGNVENISTFSMRWIFLQIFIFRLESRITDFHRWRPWEQQKSLKWNIEFTFSFFCLIFFKLLENFKRILKKSQVWVLLFSQWKSPKNKVDVDQIQLKIKVWVATTLVATEMF